MYKTVLAIVCGWMALGMVNRVDAEITLAEQGVAQATIIHNGSVSQAKELQFYLKKITGAELPMTENQGDQVLQDKPVIILELVAHVIGASDRLTGRQAYRLKTDGDRLTLSASTELGLTYAVYGLLEDHLGCRFYTFRARGLSYGGPGYEVVPQHATLILPSMDEVQEPAFMQRDFIWWPGSEPWVLKNRGGGFPGDTIKTKLGRPGNTITGGHNFYRLLPPETWFKEHPEWAPLVKGKRQTDGNMPFCYSNPEVAKALAKALSREIQSRMKNPDFDPAQPISVTQGDGFTACACEPCRRIAQAENCEAGPMFLMINRALDILARDYPQQQFVTHGYFETLPLPKHLRPHTNLWVNLVSSACSQNAAGDQVGLIAGNPANRDYAQALHDWPQAVPGRITVWHWTPFQPEWPTLFYLPENIRYWHDCGLAGVYPQLCGDNWKWLICHVFLKLAWNPKLDANQLIHQFLEDNYGKAAAPYVWEYLKLAQSGYEQSGYLPSAVRWTGWTQNSLVKMFPPVLRAKMTAAMDKALAAAQATGDTDKLANMIEARGSSIDAVNLSAAVNSGKSWGVTTDPRDGQRWFVPGADPLIPGCLARAKQAIRMQGGGEHGVLRETFSYASYFGGPLVELKHPLFTAAICPELKGEMTSVREQEQGRELLALQGAESGYRDLINDVTSQIWLPVKAAQAGLNPPDKNWAEVWHDYKNQDPKKLTTEVILSPPYYGFTDKNRLQRTVHLEEDGVRIERTYYQAKGGGLNNPARFSARWKFLLPDPRQAKVSIRGGGIDKLLDLQYAVAGGIRGVKVGERLPGQDNMDARFDDVQAVSDAEVVKLAVAENTPGNLAIQLNRGDGLGVILITPAKGWARIEMQAMVKERILCLTLIGTAIPMDAAEKSLVLPDQQLSVKRVPLAEEVVSSGPPNESKPLEPKLKISGSTTAINDADGAALVWIPAGKFMRGSLEGKGAGDELPQKEIELDGYWIYKHPVTVAQYQTFCKATGQRFKPTWGQGMQADPQADPNQYAVQVSWYEANDYAQWAGAVLPTEAQWEKAARGNDGREYPWGNRWQADKCVSMERTLYQFKPGFLPVGSTPQGASPYGVEDMAGNVWEWVADWYQYDYYSIAPERTPLGPATGSHKVLRGGCSLFDERFSRAASRMICPPQVRDWTPTGFRCVVKTHDSLRRPANDSGNP